MLNQIKGPITGGIRGEKDRGRGKSWAADRELEFRIIDGNEPTSFSWVERKDAMKPATMDQAAWDLIFANLSSGVGETWGNYITTLGVNSAYLYRHAQKKVSDTGKPM